MLTSRSKLGMSMSLSTYSVLFELSVAQPYLRSIRPPALTHNPLALHVAVVPPFKPFLIGLDKDLPSCGDTAEVLTLAYSLGVDAIEWCDHKPTCRIRRDPSTANKLGCWSASMLEDGHTSASGRRDRG
jgi:hypothetical protein